MSQHTEDLTLFAGLKELEGSAFYKRCRTCGREYATVADFIAATKAVRPQLSGLKQSLDEGGNAIVDLFRNCVCGSTLMESFSDRRDVSEAGLKRRQRFGELLDQLAARGIDRTIAHAELLKLMRGEPHDVMRLIRETEAPDQ